MENLKTGVVKWFNSVKGFGFIAPDEGGSDIFVHYTGIKGSGYKKLEENQKVQFVVETVPKGTQAVDVEVLQEVEQTA